MVTPYYSDASVTLWHGDCREVLPNLDIAPRLVIADPPYGETSLAWDRWPVNWPDAVTATSTRSMWCFGSMRMFLAHRDEFAGWRLSQDLVWAKPQGSFAASDRFRRHHEQITHWYRGAWSDIHHDTPRVKYHGPDKGLLGGRCPLCQDVLDFTEATP